MRPNRRDLLQSMGSGFGTLALAGLLDQEGLLAPVRAAEASRGANPLAPRQGHFSGKAKAVMPERRSVADGSVRS
jgi:hypothetical protein